MDINLKGQTDEHLQVLLNGCRARYAATRRVDDAQMGRAIVAEQKRRAEQSKPVVGKSPRVGYYGASSYRPVTPLYEKGVNGPCRYHGAGCRDSECEG